MRKLGLVVFVALVASAVPPAAGARPGLPGGAPASRRDAATEAAALGHQLVATALDLRGVPYRNGGTDARGFDCSGIWPMCSGSTA